MSTDNTIENTEAEVTPEITAANDVSKEVAGDSFFDIYLEAREEIAKPESLQSPEDEWAKHKQAYIDGTKTEAEAKEAFDADYEAKAQIAQETAAEQLDGITALRQLDYLYAGQDNVNYIDESYQQSVDVVEGTNSGMLKMLDTWSDETQSLRQAAVKNKVFINDTAEEVAAENGLFGEDILFNDEYADKNGNVIIGYQHGSYGKYDRGGAAVHALYANTEPIGEIVSRWDANGWMDNAALDMSMIKVAAGSVINFVVDTIDTALWIGEMNTSGVAALGLKEPQSWIRNTRNALKSWSAVQSDKDNESLMTVNNALSMGLDIVGQLLSGKIVASIAAKGLKVSAKYAKQLEKGLKLADEFKGTAKGLKYAEDAASMAKKLQKNSKYVGKLTHFYMGSMASKDLSEEARAAGFSDNEAALIGIVGLAGLGWANKLSELGLSKIGIAEFERMSKAVAKTAVHGKTAKNMTDKGLKAFLKKHSESLVNVYNKAAAAKTIGSGMLTEFAEEETELLVQEVINHAATAAAYFGYSDQDVKPGYATVLDKGYFKKFAVDAAMSGIGGAFGGGFAHFINPSSGDGGLSADDLPIQGSSNMRAMHLAYMASRGAKGAQGESIFKAELKKRYDKGEMGSQDLSTEYDETKKRYKRMSELSDAEKKTTSSQADAFYAATLGQYNFYKQLFTLNEGSFQDIVADNKQFGLIADSKELQFNIKDKLLRKQEILIDNDVIPGAMDERLTELTKLKKKTDKEGDSNPNNAIYKDALNTLSSATKIDVDKISELVGINEFTMQVESGEILENAFIETVLGSKDFEGKLTPGQLSQLVDAGIDGQTSHKELIKSAKKEQKANKEFFSKVIAGTEKFTQAHADKILTSPRLFLTPDQQASLSAAVERDLGIPLEDLKLAVSANMLAALASDVGESDLNKALTLLAPTGPDINLLDALGKALEAGSFETVINTLTTNAKADFKEGIDPELAAKIAYTFKQIDSLADIDSTEGLQKVTFSLDKDNKTLSDENFIDLSTISPFNFTEAILQPYSGVEPFIGSTEALLPIDQEADVKQALLAQINTSFDINEATDRNEFDYSFNKDSKGNISVSDESFSVALSALLRAENIDPNEEPTRFSNLKGVESFLEKLRIRKSQIQFLAQISGGLASIKAITDEVLHNEGEESSKLTTYIQEHLFDLKKMQTDSKYNAEVKSDLEASLGRLTWLEQRAEKMKELTADSDQNLQQEYIISTKEEAVGIFDTVTNAVSPEMRAKSENLSVAFAAANDFVDEDDISPEYIANLYDRATKVREALRSEYLSNPAFIDELEAVHKASSTETNPELVKLLRIAMSDADTTLSRLRAKYAAAFKAATGGSTEEVNEKLKALKLPTIKQLMMVEDAVLMASTDFILQANRFSVTDEFYNLGVFNGRQGTGKTQIVGVQAAAIIKEILDAKTAATGDVEQQIIFAANDAAQADILGEAAEAAGITRGKLNNTASVTQETLWKLLVNDNLTTEELVKRLEHVGAIIYDEIAYVEFSFDEADVKESFNNPKDAPVLNAILARLESVNKLRRAGGKLGITMLGLGDSKQGAFIKGSITPKTKISNPSKLGTFSSVFEPSAERYITMSTTELTHAFRYEIDEIRTAASDISKNLTPALSIQKSDTGGLTPVVFRFNREENNFTGVEKSDSWESTLKDTKLADTIAFRLANDPEFVLLIVDGEDAYDGTLPAESALGKVLTAYTNSNPEDAKRKILYKGISSVQGSQATYTIANIPANYLGVYKDAATGNFQNKDAYLNKLNRLSMLIGRSSRYSLLAMPTGFPISSNNGNTIEPEQAESNQMKIMWGGVLLNSVLKNYDTVREVGVSSEISPTTPAETPKSDPSTEVVVVDADKDSMGDASTTINNENEQLSELQLVGKSKAAALKELKEKKEATVDPKVIAEVENEETLIEDIEAIMNDEEVGETFELPPAVKIPATTSNKSTQDTAVMQQIEKEEGLVAMFGHRSAAAGRLTNASIAAKVGDARKLFGAANAVSNEDYDEQYSEAMGLKNEGGEDHRQKYDYSIVSYTFKWRDKFGWHTGYNHVVVAKRKTGNKNLILSSFGAYSMYSPESLTREWIGNRENTLKSIAEVGDNGDSFNIASNTAEDAFNKSATASLTEEGNLPMLTVKLRNFSSLFTGVTVGAPVMGNKTLLETAKTVVGNVFDRKVLDRMEPGEFQKKYNINSDSVKNILGTTLDAAHDILKKEANISSFVNFGTKKAPMVQALVGKTVIVAVHTTRGDLPFASINGRWLPVLGTVDGKVITDRDAVTAAHANRDAELLEISLKLKKIKGLTAISIDAAKLPDRFVQDQFGYDADVLNSFNGARGSELAYLRRVFNQKTNLFFANKRISLEDAMNTVWPKTGEPSSVSAPYVITRGAKEHVGKTMILYTFDKSKRLDKLTPKELTAQFNKTINAQRATPTGMSTNRDGIGMLLLDSAPKTFTELSAELYNEENRSTNSRLFNRVISHGATGQGVIKMLATLHAALGTNVSDQVLGITGMDSDSIKEMKGRMSKTKFNKLATLLSKVFDAKNLGSLRIGVSADTLASIDAIKRLDDPVSQEDYFKIMLSSSAIRPDLDALGIDTLAKLLEAPAVDGKNSTGLMRLNNGKPSISSTKDTVITMISEDTIRALTESNVIPDKDFKVDMDINMIRLLTLINGDAEVLTQLDAAMRTTPEIAQGLYVSPICAKSPSAISRAIPASKTTTVAASLTTNVKQIIVPNLVLKVETLTSGRAFVPKVSNKGIIPSISPKVVEELTVRLQALKAITDIDVFAQMIPKAKKAIEEADIDNESDRTALFTLLEGIVKAKSNPAPKTTNAVEIMDLKQHIETATDPKLKAALETMDRLQYLITTEQEALELQASLQSMGITVPVPPIRTLKEQHAVVIDMLDRGIQFPSDIEGDDAVVLDAVLRNGEANHGLGASLLDIFLLFTHETDAVIKSKLEKILRGALDVDNQVKERSKMDALAFNTNNPKNVKHKYYPQHIKAIVTQLASDSIKNFDETLTALTEPSRYPKVFARMVSRANSEEKAQLYHAYLSDIQENYYNTASRVNALAQLFDAIEVSDISVEAKDALQLQIRETTLQPTAIPMETFSLDDVKEGFSETVVAEVQSLLDEQAIPAALFKNALNTSSNADLINKHKEAFSSMLSDSADTRFDNKTMSEESMDLLDAFLEAIETTNNICNV